MNMLHLHSTSESCLTKTKPFKGQIVFANDTTILLEGNPYLSGLHSGVKGQLQNSNPKTVGDLLMDT